jgi:transglutaminase-like putative cysteine protease
LLLLLAVGGMAADPPARPLYEAQETVYLDGTRIGSLRTTYRETGTAGLFRAETVLELSFKCYGSPVRVRREIATEESSDGRVSAVSMKQLQDRGQQLELKGTVEDGKLHVLVDGGRIERRLPWNDEVLGIGAQERLFVERRPKQSEQFAFLRYEPTFNTVVNVRVSVKSPEAVPNETEKLLRVELQPDRIESKGTSVQPPGSVIWLDKAFRTARREIELDGIGKVLLLRDSKAAPAPAATGSLDIGLRNLVPVNRRIANPYATRSAVYRVTLKGEPASALTQDAHQEIGNRRGDSFDLHVHPVPPPHGAKAGPAASEYLTRSYFIDFDNPRIRDMARRAVGGETDAWSKAVRIERFVAESMRPASGAPLTPASQIAREMSGDCRAYAILTTALCRTVEIPSRTAIGLIYTERGSGEPRFGFHMWTEVNIGGRWIGLDGTSGRGGIGACYLKISDHSWSATRSLAPLLPASRVMGKIAVEVLSTDGAP